MYLLSVTTWYLAVFCPGQHLRSQEGGCPQHRKCPGRQSPIPKAADRAGRAANSIPCSPRHGKGWSRARALHGTSQGGKEMLQCTDLRWADELPAVPGCSQETGWEAAPPAQPWAQLEQSPWVGCGWNPPGRLSGQLEPGRALKAPGSQSNYVIYHCLSPSWHRFFIDDFSFPYCRLLSQSLVHCYQLSTCCLCLPPPQD